MEAILRNVNKMILDTGANAQGVLPYLPLPELTRPGTGSTGGQP
jgi:hypothetical protein